MFSRLVFARESEVYDIRKQLGCRQRGEAHVDIRWENVKKDWILLPVEIWRLGGCSSVLYTWLGCLRPWAPSPTLIPQAFVEIWSNFM